MKWARKHWMILALAAGALLLFWLGRASNAAATAPARSGLSAGPGRDPPAGFHWEANLDMANPEPWILVPDSSSDSDLDALMSPVSGSLEVQ